MSGRALWNQRGQTTVEAAIIIPILLFALLLVIQPGILLYTHLVMQGAAAEACRIVATESQLEKDNNVVKNYVKRKLAAVPQQDNFHVHSSGCTWQINYSGSETSNEVMVEISNEIKPLPFFDFGLRALGLLNDRGNFEIKTSHKLASKSGWVQSNTSGNNPRQWVERWNN